MHDGMNTTLHINQPLVSLAYMSVLDAWPWRSGCRFIWLITKWKISADLCNPDLIALNFKRGSRSGFERRDARKAEIALPTCIRINGKMRRHEECEDIPAMMHHNGINFHNKYIFKNERKILHESHPYGRKWYNI